MPVDFLILYFFLKKSHEHTFLSNMQNVNILLKHLKYSEFWSLQPETENSLKEQP